MLDLCDHLEMHAALQLVLKMRNKDVLLSDCDNDGSDMEYEGETGHLPSRVLNTYAELMQTDH